MAGRSAIGTDVDPLALFVSRAKTQPYNITKLTQLSKLIAADLAALKVADEERNGALTEDIDDAEYEVQVAPVRSYVPNLAALHHWFRRRVVVQLASILVCLNRHCDTAYAKTFFSLCFASIIRNSSNADPVPVSGLEVTKHMKAREELGRAINVYDLMAAAMTKTLTATKAFATAREHSSARALVKAADARHLHGVLSRRVEAVITSPPYLSAVDYYRRHQLEMFWLSMVSSQDDRLQLLPLYIGRSNVSGAQLQQDAFVPCRSKLGRQWERKLRETRPERARAVQHYAGSMARTLDGLLELVKKGGNVVLVVGDSQIQKETFPTGQLIAELAPRQLQLEEVLWYPLENRYMSYSRHNGANIKIEQVLVFRRS